MAQRACGGCSGGRYGERTLFVRQPRDLRLLTRKEAQFDDIIFDKSVLLDRTEQDTIQLRLLRLHGECGCEAGGVAFIICALALSLTGAITRARPSFEMLGVAFFVCVFAAGVGKLVWLIRARLQLRSEIQRLAAFLK
jgi:hypothetical protein